MILRIKTLTAPTLKIGVECLTSSANPQCTSGCLFCALSTLMHLTFALYLMVYSYSNAKVSVAVCFWYLWLKFQWAVTLPAPPSSRVGNHAYIRAAEWKDFIELRWIRWMSMEQWGGHVLQIDLEAFYQSALGHMNFRWLYILTIADTFKNVITSLVKDRNFFKGSYYAF